MDLLATSGSSLVELAVRATVVFFVALVLEWLTRREPAATRHQLWTLTFALLLVLPVLALTGPSWDVPLLPTPDPAGDEVRKEPVVNPVPAGLAAAAASSPSSAALDAPVPATKAVVWPWRSLSLLLLIWAIGCGAALVSIGVGILRFQRLVGSAEPVGDPVWHRQLDAVQDELGFRRDVRLLLGGEAGTPMAGGLWQPIILLPASAADWSQAQLRMVLAHELVHVRRRDALRQLASRVVLAFYWFHPLSWVASRIAAARREEACDEEVLAVGPRPSEYAGHLLSLAEGRAIRRPVLSLPMVQQPSRLERRIRAILNPHRARPRKLVTAVASTAVVVVGLVTSVATPILLASVPDTVPEIASVMPARVECVVASDSERPPGQVFLQGLDSDYVCTVRGEPVSSHGNEVGKIGPADWAALDAELRKQIAQVKAEDSVWDREEKLAPPAGKPWVAKTLSFGLAETDARRGLSPRWSVGR